MPRRDVEEWFEHVGREMALLSEELAAGRPRVGKPHWEPRVDLFEEDARLLIRVEIAGVRIEDVAVHYVPERHSVTVRGFRPDEGPASGERRAAHLLEIPMGEFAREVALPPVSVDAKGIRAQYRAGVLYVSVPKVDRVVVMRTTVVREI